MMRRIFLLFLDRFSLTAPPHIFDSFYFFIAPTVTLGRTILEILLECPVACILVVVFIFLIWSSVLFYQKSAFVRYLFPTGLFLLVTGGFLLISKLPFYAWISLLAGASMIFVDACYSLHADPRFHASAPLDESPSRFHPKCRMLLLVIILAIGFIFRFYHLDRFPPGHSGHCAVWSYQAIQLLKDPQAAQIEGVGILSRTVSAFDRLILKDPGNENVNIFFPWLLYHFLPPSFLFERSLTAAIGMLSIPLIFVAGKRLLDPDAGLIAAFLMAICPWHVCFSRYNAVDHILTPVIVTLTILCGVHAIDRQSLTGTFFATACLCACFMFYLPCQFSLVIIAAYWFRTLVTTRIQRRKLIAGLIVVTVSIAFIVPTAKFFPFQIGREPGRSLSHPGGVPAPLFAGLAFLFFDGWIDPWFFKPGGVLPLFTALLFLIGLSRSAAFFRQPWHFLILSWLLIGYMPALFSNEGIARRTLAAYPAILLIAAQGWRSILDRIAPAPKTRVFRWILNTGFAIMITASFLHILLKRVEVQEVWRGGRFLRIAQIITENLRISEVVAFMPAGGVRERISLLSFDFAQDSIANRSCIFLDDFQTLGRPDKLNFETAPGMLFLAPANETGARAMEALMERYPTAIREDYLFDETFLDHSRGMTLLFGCRMQ